MVFTKQYGFRFSDTPHDVIVDRTCVADVGSGGVAQPTLFFLWGFDGGL